MRRRARPRRSRRRRRACGPCAGAESAGGVGTSARSEQRHGQDALLWRDAAMEEGATITALILAQLRRVDEKGVARGEQRVRSKPAARQLQRILIGEAERVIGIFGAQILTELVA